MKDYFYTGLLAALILACGVLWHNQAELEEANKKSQAQGEMLLGMQQTQAAKETLLNAEARLQRAEKRLDVLVRQAVLAHLRTPEGSELLPHLRQVENKTDAVLSKMRGDEIAFFDCVDAQLRAPQLSDVR
jgi:hypothetical protein